MLKKFIRIMGGDPNKREIDRLSALVDQINDLEPAYELLSDHQLRAKTDEFRSRISQAVAGIDNPKDQRQAEQDALDDILPEAFAVVREASKRTTGMRPFDVQMLGGIALHMGKIAEMRTGEGKTLVAVMPIYLNALLGRGVHLITVNDYLARLHARWMGRIYIFLGLSVGVLQMAARTENGKKAFVVDLEKESPHEDQRQLRLTLRGEAYAADVTYGTNAEFGFDYLRDNMTMSLEERVQRGHYYAIVDEVDNVLIDEARTPLIISGAAQDESEAYMRMAQIVRQLKPEDYEIDEKDRTATLTEIGELHVEELLGEPLRDPDRPEDVTLEQARLLGYLEQGMRAQFLYKRNKDYLVQGGKVVIVDEFTGRLMPGRRWSDGLHQAVEAKEGVKVESESVTYATITIQNYFRMYQKLAGMSGTALTESEEFDKIYQLGVVVIPTNLEYQTTRPDAAIIEVDAKDESGYKYNYFTPRDDPNRFPLFWRRKDYPDVIFRTQEVKLRSISQEILRFHVLGRPVLVGTTSVDLSERLSNRLRAEPLRMLARTLLIRDAYIRKHHIEEDGRRIDELQFLYASAISDLDTSVLRKWCRDLEISFNPEDPGNLRALLHLLDLEGDCSERLSADLQAGIPHEVLNARKHTEESQIIAGAGGFGAVTIATNMAGRGVDIKLGGELAEEVGAAVNRVLAKNNIADPYDMTMEQRLEAIQALPRDAYGIYETEVDYFLKYMQEAAQVKALGGLHVIGSERHEARRIDNQLRGRAARQGDPGSSRFYLSMEDDLMRLFGGQQADALMQRLKVDESLPLEVGLVSRLIEQSQTRVEGSNFDVRKHLLEYDDVLNSQRMRIYADRNRIFEKEDLTGDVIEMLQTELAKRVPEALQDEGGPWKLLAWLDRVQPSIDVGGQIFPTYTLRLLVEVVMARIKASPNLNSLRAALLEAATASLEAEHAHHIQAISEQLIAAEDRLESQVEERLDAIDIFFDGLEVADETDTRSPADLVNELSAQARVSIKMTPDDQRKLRQSPRTYASQIRATVRSTLRMQTISRQINMVERRIGDSLDVTPSQLVDNSWRENIAAITAAAEDVLNKRRQRWLGENGQIVKDLDAHISKLGQDVNDQTILNILLALPKGEQVAFNKRHQRVVQHTNRLNYAYYAATLLENREARAITDEVLAHFEDAQEAYHLAWGKAEFGRLTNLSISDLVDNIRRHILAELGLPENAEAARRPLGSLPEDQQAVIIDELGRSALTAIYRQLLLSVITELWVDYLTQMESLRISVGLEAYAQRDPLVQYKSRAAELYGTLQSNIRYAVLNGMFTYRPRELRMAQSAPTARPDEVPSAESAPAEALEPVLAGQPTQAAPQKDEDKKRKRRRR